MSHCPLIHTTPVITSTKKTKNRNTITIFNTSNIDGFGAFLISIKNMIKYRKEMK
jgi:hypothetical protein